MHGHVPAPVPYLTAVASLPVAQQINLAIGLPLRNRETLTNLLQQISDPSSSSYRQYLTPAQFTERFGPSEQDYLALTEFVKTNGLRVTGLHANRMLLNVGGSVGDIERVFHVTLRSYTHPSEARTFFAPDVEPSLDCQVPVNDISGLSDFSKPHPNFVLRPQGGTVKSAIANSGSGSGGSFMGNDFRAAYLPGVTLTGSGQTVALIQFDGYLASDIAAYESQAGLPSVTLSNVLLDGFSGTPTGNGGEVEVSMDIELAIAMAPGLSRVIVYEGNPNSPNFIPNDVLNRVVLDNAAKQISCSWTWTGGPSTTTDQIFQQMIAQGQSFFTASGDVDSYKNGAVDNASLFGYPAQSPYVTSVGGTVLTTTGPGGSYLSETVWNTRTWDSKRSAYDGSSGGISTFYAIPSWQQGVSMASNGGSTVNRNFPDVALTGDNVFVIADNGVPYTVGGTSCAAPLWAGFMALVNQQGASQGIPPVGFLNPTIYAIGRGSNYTVDLHDTTTGDNTSPDLLNANGSTNQFYAVVGYDLCAGWGSPAGSSLINDLTLPPLPMYRLYAFPLDSDPGWSRQGQWAFGHPLGQGGLSRGSPDPTNGATGTNVFGVNLSGDYSLTVGGPYYLITGPLNFGGCANVTLQFQRWLNTDYQSRVTDTVEVSSNGTVWSQVFINGTTAITQSAWSNCQYNISAIADNQTNVFVRWGYRIVSSRARAYSGWNIDDISFLGQLPVPGASNSIVAVAPLGTPMSWMVQYGLTNDAFNITELSDSDGDGVTNWQEYVADTDPTNKNSFFHIVAASNRPPWAVYFVSSTARQYSLEYNTNLIGGAGWNVVGGQTGLYGSAGTGFLGDTNLSGSLFYRVRAQLPP